MIFKRKANPSSDTDVNHIDKGYFGILAYFTHFAVLVVDNNSEK